MIGSLIGAWLDVRSKPLRTLAAIAGMVAAIVAVVLVDAASILSHEANDIYLARKYGLAVTMSIAAESGNATRDDDERLETTLRTNGITTLSPYVSVGGIVTYDGAEVAGGVRWLSPEYRDIRVVDLVAGAWPEVTARSDVLHVVVTAGWASEALGLSDQDVVGFTLGFAPATGGTFDRQTTPVIPMVVDAVASTATNAFMFGEAPVSVVTSLDPPLLRDNVYDMSWVVRVNPGDVGLLQDLVRTVTDASGQPIYTPRRADQADQLAPVLDQQSVTARAISIVALTIGGLGILGVGIASVRERSRDFGLQRALGAGRGRIFADVVVQALLEVLIAAAIAILIAAVLLEWFARDLVLAELPLPPSTALPGTSALKGIAAAILVGVAASLIPAISAARASVIQALRG